MAAESKTYLLDICWTLYRSNTTFDFIDFITTDNGYRRRRQLRRCRLWRLIHHLVFRLTRRDRWREDAIRQLQGMRRDEIERLARLFVNNVLAEKKIEAVWQTIQDADNIVILSSTLEPIANAIARQLPVVPKKIYSTELSYHDDIATGQVLTDRLPQKLNSEQQPAPRSYIIITDNTSDLELIAKAEQAYIVTYHNQRRWQKLIADKISELKRHGTETIPPAHIHYLASHGTHE